MIARLQTATAPGGIALLAAGMYLVLIGGTTIGETDPGLRLISGFIGGGVIVVYLLRGPALMDRIDRGVLLALLLFAGAAVLSTVPRQSFDASVTALAYAAGLFVARGSFSEEWTRNGFVILMIALSVILTLLFAQLWLGAVLEWWTLTDFRVVPPLNFELAGFPWGHRHDLTMLIVMLYPAWWVGRPSPLRRVAAMVVGALGVLVVAVDGSRIVWLAIAAATAIPAGTWLTRRRWDRRAAAGAVALIGMTVAVLLLTGVGSSFLERGLSSATLDWRAAMWGPLIEQWTTQPLAGAGPGSYPWILQRTAYFDTNSWAPRHPDSVLVQTLAEGGLLGLAAVAILLATLAPAVLRGRSVAARWALMVFTVASIGATPTNFGFLIVVAVGWVAFARPRDPTAAQLEGPLLRAPGLRFRALAFGMVAVMYGLFAVGSFAYEQARAAVEEGRLDDAHGPLTLARALDPTLAIYPRQQGAIHLLQGASDDAVSSLEEAVRLNPADDLGWRTLALAKDAQGDLAARDDALNRAVRLQRSDVTNLLLRAYWDAAEEREREAAAALAEVIQAWPAVVYSPAWADLAEGAGGSSIVASDAVTRWLVDAPMPERPMDQGLWLAALADRPDVRARALSESPWGRPLSEAMVASLECDLSHDEVLDQLPIEAYRATLFWMLKIHAASLTGSTYADDARMLELMGNRISVSSVTDTLNPLNENGLGRGDRWGYRRDPIDWPTIQVELPDPEIGQLRWMLEPVVAIKQSGLANQLGKCGAVTDS